MSHDEQGWWKDRVAAKVAALEVLGPLGFHDCDDGENPAMIGISLTLEDGYAYQSIDAFKVPLPLVISTVYREAVQAGMSRQRHLLRQCLGIDLSKIMAGGS